MDTSSTNKCVISSSRFDYGNLEDAVAEEARAAANRIRENLRRIETTAIEVGRDLLSIKEKLDHGEFGKWIKEELRLGDRSVQYAMNVARLADEKSEIVSLLPTKAAYGRRSTRTPAGSLLRTSLRCPRQSVTGPKRPSVSTS